MCEDSYFSNGLVYNAHTPQARPKGRSFFMKIKITVPKEKNDKWQVSVGRSNYKKRDSTAAFRIVEKKIKNPAAS